MVDGRPLPRLDAESKVRGQARYAGDLSPGDALHAVIVGSTIACGRIVGVNADAVLRLPGVVAVITHREAMKLRPTGYRLPLQNDRVRFAGEPVAVVVADDLSPRAAALRRCR